MRVVSPSALQAMLARETDKVFLVALKVMHPSMATIRVVNNTQVITRTDGVYQPFPFSLNLPAETDDAVPQITVQFDNVDSLITDAIREISGKRPIMEFDVILADTPDVVEAGPFSFSVISATYDVMTVSCTLGFEEDILNQSVPKGNYNPANSPGLFV